MPGLLIDVKLTIFYFDPLSFYFLLQDSCNKFVVPHDVMNFSEGKITELKIASVFVSKDSFLRS